MRGYKMILLASAAALISTGAMADDRKVLKVSNTLDEIFLEEVTDTITVDMIENIVTKFEIDQTNRGDINAHTKVVASNVDGYTASAVAIANNASVDVKGNAAGSNWQGNWGNVIPTFSEADSFLGCPKRSISESMSRTAWRLEWEQRFRFGRTTVRMT